MAFDREEFVRVTIFSSRFNLISFNFSRLNANANAISPSDDLRHDNGIENAPKGENWFSGAAAGGWREVFAANKPSSPADPSANWNRH